MRRSFRRRRMARPRYRPRYRRSRRSRKVASRRQADVGDHLGQLRAAIWPGQALLALLLRSCPASRLPDYQLTYSQFRVLKCRLQLSLGSEGGEVDNFLVAPSRPFARNMGPSNLGDNRSEVRPRRRRVGSTSDQVAEGHLPQQDNQETIDWLQAVHPGGHPGSIQYAERPMGLHMGVQSLDALQLG